MIVHTFDFQAQACGEVLLVADHDVDVFCDLGIYLLGFLWSPDALPERRPIVQVIGNDRAVLFSGRNSFHEKARRCLAKSGEDAARVEPAHAEIAEDVVPIKGAGFKLTGRGVAAIRYADSTADAEAALREIEAIADGAANAIARHPFDEPGIDAALEDEIFKQATDVVVGESGADGGLEPEAAPEATS